jgi:hypothetical protein
MTFDLGLADASHSAHQPVDERATAASGQRSDKPVEVADIDYVGEDHCAHAEVGELL